MKKCYLFALLVILITMGSFQSRAQHIRVLKREGEKCFRKEQYRNALPFFEQILKTNPENLNALYKSGVCKLHRFSKEEGLQNLEKVYSTDSTYNKYLLFWLARGYHLNYDFKKANLFYVRCQDKISKINIQYREVERYKYQLTCAEKYISDPSNYNIQNLGSTINSNFSEHSPVLSSSDSLLLFTSRRTNINDVKEEYDGEPFEDIFYSTKIDSVHWTEPISFQLNTSGHDASIQLYNNDNNVFIYSYQRGGDIYTSTKENGNWTLPQPFDEINTVDFEADVFLTADGKTLYYATNHFKKKGDLDIHYLTLNADGTWSKSKALSSLINSEEDEDAPYITADGKTMYFSSRGHTSMGGYDIFKSTWDSLGNAWGKPINLGYPVNTPDDDLYFILSHTSSKGYFSSYRTGGYGEKDIYEISPIEEIQIKGLLVYANDAPLNKSGFTVKIKSNKTDLSNATSQEIHVEENGSFNVTTLSAKDYHIFIFENDSLIATDTLFIGLVSKKDQQLNYTYILPEKEQKDSVPTFPTSVADSLKTIPTVVDSTEKDPAYTCYYPINSSVIGATTKSELKEILEYLNTHAKAKITISGHTDASGSDEINNKLALKRATNVKAYFVSKGISEKRIQVESFGSTMPFAKNDVEANRAKNRRVEVRVQ